MISMLREEGRLHVEAWAICEHRKPIGDRRLLLPENPGYPGCDVLNALVQWFEGDAHEKFGSDVVPSLVSVDTSAARSRCRGGSQHREVLLRRVREPHGDFDLHQEPLPRGAAVEGYVGTSGAHILL